MLENLFSNGAHIQSYIEEAAYDHHLDENVMLDTEVTGAAWDSDSSTWSVVTAGKLEGRQEHKCKILVSAVGNLTIPVRPYNSEATHTESSRRRT